MATPLVSGVAAIHLSQKPWLTPADVKDVLINDSVSDVLVYDERIIPRSFWAITENRLLQIPTMCGGSQFFLNSGSITSPGYPNKYPADLCCIWNITAEENQFVQFDLYDLHLEDKNDVLKVYDGSCPPSDDNDTDLVKEFTGNHQLERYTYHTESNILCLKLVTDGTTSFKGFNATYTKVTTCGSNFTTSTGTFQTPNWPQTYPAYLNCEWFIELPDAKKVVEITCADEPYRIAGTYPDCSGDFITFYDGHTSQNTSYGPYCEFTKPGTIKMSTNLARVHFFAGSSYNSSYVGVKCLFRSVDVSPPPPPCGGLLNTSNGTFQSPNWPKTYPVNIDCVWRIQLPDSNMLVKIECNEDPFGIAGFLPACEKDYLKLYNGHSKQDIEFGPFCYYEKPLTTIMPSSKAMAIFHAGPVHNPVRKGFKCSFESIHCGRTLTAAHGSFQSPNWPETYPVNITCTWSIALPDSSKRVEINFEIPFGIAGYLPTCAKDKLYVYDDNTGIQHGPYCYFTVPNPPVMTSNQARVVLHAGPVHSPSRVGFKATYHSVP